ncbi:MAG: T9SS type A sorting domain-containing protein [Bacteroidetes bacterium]|nr:T9SS type A sorting domain-containing protein [Bacteroidota bacterium]
MLRFTYFFLFFLLALSAAQAQNTTCANAIRICLNTPVTYPASTGAGAAESGPDYGCLGSEPNPAWFIFRIDNPGTHSIQETNSQGRDLDFILYGPFQNETGNCGNLTAANTADCSYAGGATESIDFTSVNQGDYYILLVTNFSNQPTNVTFNQTSGTGTFDCNFTGECQISLVTTNPGDCDSLTNTYTLQGSVFSFYPPAGGQLIVSSGGETQTINGPFNNTTSFSISGLPSNGAASTVSASFNATSGCSSTANFTAPSGCLPCVASAISNGPVCAGQTLELTTNYAALADYQWTGPNGFSSTEANPVIEGVTIAATGTYTVLIEGQNCVSERDVEVEIIGAPDAVITTPSDTICEGSILFLGAAEIPGATWSWAGPLAYSSSARNNQILDAQPENSGLYVVSAERAGCTGVPDSVYYLVNANPEISIVGDTIQTPGEAGIIYISGPSGMTYYWNFIGDETLIDLAVYTGNNDTLAVFWDDREGDLLIQVVGIDENGCASNQAVLSTHITNADFIPGIGNTDSFQVYPNPARDNINLANNSKAELICALYSSEGKLIKSFDLPRQSVVSVNLDQLDTGLYFVRSGSSIRKFVIAR